MTREELIHHIRYTLDIGADITLTNEEGEEIIRALEQEPCEDWYDVPSDEMTLEQARQAVKDLRKKLAEYLEQEPCPDAISRQAVEKITWEEPSYSDALNVLTEVRDKVRALPPVNPQPKTGHWISHYDEDAKVGWYECDRCHTERAFNNDYCPDCGAKMESEGEE